MTNKTQKLSKFPFRAVLIVLFLLQLCGTSYAIWSQYSTQSKGTAFLFQTKPVDPRDYFRGQYVALRFEVEKYYPFTGCKQDNYRTVSPLYVILEADAKGTAKISKISEEKPNNAEYLTLKSGYCDRYDENKGKVRVNLPFNRYYANENEALDLEKQARKNPEQTFLKVWVNNGSYSVDTLILPQSED